MDLTICQSCKKVFDQTQRLPKVLSCGCIQCAKCIKNILKVTETIKCKIHNQLVNIQENNLKDFKIQNYYMQEINKFEQQSNLLQVIQDLSSQAKLQNSKVISIKKAGLNFQKIFSEIVRQVTQILCQKEVSGCQKIVVQIEDVLKKMNTINEKYQKIKNLQFENSQQLNSGIIELNNLVQEFEGMQTEVQSVRVLNYQGNNQNYRIIQEISFQVFQEFMGMSTEQNVLIQDFSDIISKFINQQNIPIPNQPVQIIPQSLQEFKIESIQQLQNILVQFQNKQMDVSYILNNPQGTMNLFKNYMILQDLVQLKSDLTQQHLLQIINESKNQPKMQAAAANALSMLNFMNFQFTNQNFQNLDLSKSDLSDTTFTNCNFANSNLTQANLRNTKFINCDLSNSNLTSIITEHPHIFTGHTNCVNSIAISSNSEFIVSGSSDKTVILWDVKTNTSKAMSDHTSSVYAVAISSDSQFIVSGSRDNTVRLWEVKTGTSKTMRGHTDFVNAVAISSYSEFIVSGSRDKTVRLWEVKTGTSKTMSGHTSSVNSISISSDSEFIISGSEDSTIRLWNVKSLACIKVLSGHSDWVLSVIFSFDGRRIISGSRDSTIRVWNVESGLCECVLCGHTGNVGSLSLLRDSNWLVSSNQSIFS